MGTNIDTTQTLREGEVVEADKNILRGIRGAGDAFGPIVELTVKLYPPKAVG